MPSISCGPSKYGSLRIDNNCADEVDLHFCFAVADDSDVAAHSEGLEQGSSTSQFRNILSALATIAGSPTGVTVTPGLGEVA